MKRKKLFGSLLLLAIAPLIISCTPGNSRQDWDNAVAILGLDGGSNYQSNNGVASKSVEEAPINEKAAKKVSMTPSELYESGMSNYEQEKYVEALSLYRAAADKGLAEAQYKLGFMYEKGLGVKQDGVESINWYDKAAEQGHAGAQLKIGNLHYNKRDYAEALSWYHKSAEQGNKYAQNVLGVIYSKGNGGVRIDYTESLRWLSKSAEQGNKRASKDLEAVKEKQKMDKRRREAFKTLRLTKNTSGQAVVTSCDIGGMMYKNLTFEATPVLSWGQRFQEKPKLYITFRDDGFMKIADEKSSKVIYEGKSSYYSPSKISKAIGYSERGYIVYGVYCPLDNYGVKLDDYGDGERYYTDKGKLYYYEKKNSIYTLKLVKTAKNNGNKRVAGVQ